MKTADIFQNGMILQRDKPIKIWGTANPREKISVTIQGKKRFSVADEKGNWMVEMPELHVSESEEMEIQGNRDRICLRDIAVGEIWIAGGQSNMEYYMRYEKHYQEEVEACENRYLRFYAVPQIIYDGQEQDFDYSQMKVWRKATKQDLEYFSGVGYYFQKEIMKKLNVPVGIVGCNWGGSNSSVWMKEESVAKYGKIWITEFEDKTKNLDLESLWKRQPQNPCCGRGLPFADALTEFTLPVTRTEEELEEFIYNHCIQIVPEDTLLFTKPGICYEKMVKAVAPFSVRGVLWYQGESDDGPGKADIYGQMLEAVIRDWREAWEDELPFLVVQLPGYETFWGLPNQCYSVIRNCQEKVARTVSGVYLASISDAGEQFDIHPKDKMVVGHRLALLARGHVYGEELLCDAPFMDRVNRLKDRLQIHFANAQGGLLCENTEKLPLHVFCGEREISVKICVDGEYLLIDINEENIYGLRVAFAQEKFFVVNLVNRSDIPALPFCWSEV